MTTTGVAEPPPPPLHGPRYGSVKALLARQRPDLLGLAHALCGDTPMSAELVGQAVTRVLVDARLLDDEGTGPTHDEASIAARVWIVRGYLSEGMVLGAPVAADVNAPIAQLAADPPDAARSVGSVGSVSIAARVAVTSKLGRATLVLHYAEGLPEADIARTVGSTAEAITRYLDDLRARLGVDEGNEDELRAVIGHLRHGDVAQDVVHPHPDDVPAAEADLLDVLGMFADTDDADDADDADDGRTPDRAGRLTLLARAVTGRRAR